MASVVPFKRVVAVRTGPEHQSISRVAFDPEPKGSGQKRSEGAMAIKQNGQIIETAEDARQAEPGPSVLALLAMSTGLAVLILGVVWFVFFRT
jgi:hypothetical protein